MPETRYRVVFAPQIVKHLETIDRKHHSLIRQTIREQLPFEPLKETRNRKPIQGMTAFGLVWELRFGPHNSFRVLYSVDLVARSVEVVAIGVKEGNRLLIGGEEIEL